MKPKKELPTPKMLLVEARGSLEKDAPIDLRDYADVIGELRAKNFSYGEIVDWLAARLDRHFNKGAVHRVFKEWEEEQAARAQQLAEEIADGAGEPPMIDPEEAETAKLTGELLEVVQRAIQERKIPTSFAINATKRLQGVLDDDLRSEAEAESFDKKR